MFPRIRVFTPNHPMFNRVFHYFGNTHIIGEIKDNTICMVIFRDFTNDKAWFGLVVYNDPNGSVVR